MLRTAWILLLTTIATFVSGQQLDRYIDMALRQNKALQQINYDIDHQKMAIKEAKANALPTLGLNARYTRAGGGRAVEFPIGDLVNPAYSNLNVINAFNASQPGYPAIPIFPEVPNQSFNFFRESEQESKIQLLWPIVNSGIRQNRLLQERLLSVEERKVNMAEADLIQEVRTAYYNYLKAEKAIAIFDTSIALVRENIRTTTSLYRNDRITQDQLLLAEAQLKSVEYQKEEAKNNAKSAQAYFNYLLDQRYDRDIIRDQPADAEPLPLGLDQYIRIAINARQELNQLDAAIDLVDNEMALAKSKFKPTLSIAADYGVQGVDYNINNDSDFYLSSAVLQWNIFNKADRIKAQSIGVKKQQRTLERQDAEHKIQLQVINAYNGVVTALKNIELVQAEERAAKAAFDIVEKKYRLGRAKQIEYTDARVSLTSAQQKRSITLYDYWIRRAELDFAVGNPKGRQR